MPYKKKKKKKISPVKNKICRVQTNYVLAFCTRKQF